MRIKIGLDDYDFRQRNTQTPIFWDSRQVVNGHLLLVGKSGTGKTHTLRRFIKEGIATGDRRARFHVMDVHGDIEIPGCSTVMFSESTDYGLNPLKINPDPRFGGVRKRIQSFLSTLNRTQSRPLGPKQESVLRSIVLELYEANGFYSDKPESWHLEDGVQRRFKKKFPNIEDCYRFAYSKYKQMYLGTDSSTIKALEEVSRTSSKLHVKLKQLNGAKDEEVDKLEADIKKLSDQAAEAFSAHLAGIQTGHELDSLLKYDSKDVLKSVLDRLDNMKATGLFKNRLPPFDYRNQVWRYDLCALNEEEKRMFVEFCLQDLFAAGIQRGPVDDVMDVIVLDEAHLFFREDEDNIVNTIAKEGRKFGLALFCASQSPTHFSDDFVANVASKIILGIDQMYWDSAARKMRIDAKLLSYLVPQQTISTQINNKGSGKSAFRQVYVGAGS